MASNMNNLNFSKANIADPTRGASQALTSIAGLMKDREATARRDLASMTNAIKYGDSKRMKEAEAAERKRIADRNYALQVQRLNAARSAASRRTKATGGGINSMLPRPTVPTAPGKPGVVPYVPALGNVLSPENLRPELKSKLLDADISVASTNAGTSLPNNLPVIANIDPTIGIDTAKPTLEDLPKNLQLDTGDLSLKGRKFDEDIKRWTNGIIDFTSPTTAPISSVPTPEFNIPEPVTPMTTPDSTYTSLKDTIALRDNLATDLNDLGDGTQVFSDGTSIPIEGSWTPEKKERIANLGKADAQLNYQRTDVEHKIKQLSEVMNSGYLSNKQLTHTGKQLKSYKNTEKRLEEASFNLEKKRIELADTREGAKKSLRDLYKVGASPELIKYAKDYVSTFDKPKTPKVSKAKVIKGPDTKTRLKAEELGIDKWGFGESDFKRLLNSKDLVGVPDKEIATVLESKNRSLDLGLSGDVVDEVIKHFKDLKADRLTRKGL